MGLIPKWRFGKENLMRRMSAGVDLVKIALFEYLSLKFVDGYGQEAADSLAAAVLNRLFCDEPTNAEAARFSDLNSDLVNSELSNLKNEDEEIREAITQALRMKWVVDSYRRSAPIDKAIDMVDQAHTLGILIPRGEFPSPESFLRMASKFHDTCMSLMTTHQESALQNHSKQSQIPNER